MSRATLIDRLAALLDEERDALANPDPVRLGQLAERKQDLVTRLEAATGPASARSVRMLAERARHNARLIEAARRGLRDAQALLARIRAPQNHETYGPGGRRERHDHAGGRLERRA